MSTTKCFCCPVFRQTSLFSNPFLKSTRPCAFEQALASEFELASALFSDDRKGTAEQREARSASKRFSEQSDDVDGDFRVEAADMASVLDRIFEGVCRPFKVG
jgi:hypothetical protein